MARITINPVFDMETMELIGHDGQYDVDDIPLKFDRGVQKTAKAGSQQAESTAGNLASQAEGAYSAIVPGLERQAQNPTGFTPQEKNNMLVGQQESVGGGNAAVTGEGKLSQIRTRGAGGLAPMLDEAARAKGRTLATGNLEVQNEDARLAQQKQQQAQQMLAGLYGTDTSNMLKSMGLANQDLSTELEAGRQGWLQNTEGVLNSIGNLGKGATAGPLKYV